MGEIKVHMDPEQRARDIAAYCERNGLGDVKEEPSTAYCSISLTNTPEQIKPFVRERQAQLMDLLGSVGIHAYDPGSSLKYSPDLNLDATPGEVYSFDVRRVISGEYFSGHKIFLSEGLSIENEIAKHLGKLL